MKVKRTNHTPDSYCAALMHRGWRRAGGLGGSFCRVYIKGNTAIKVGTRPDWAYLALARKVMRWGHRTPWLPRITSAHRMLSIPTLCAEGTRERAWFLVVVMERLESCDSEWYGDFGLCARLTIETFEGRQFRKELDLRTDRILRMVTRVFGTDWHGGNVMRRPSDGHIVVTDPIYSFRTKPVAVRF